MNTVKVTQEQYYGVQNLINVEGRSRESILKAHSEALMSGNKKYWSLASMNDLSYEQMALLLYNLDYVEVELSTEDQLRELAKSAPDQSYYDGVLDTAKLLGFPNIIFESLDMEWALPEKETE